jgi:hypothetical protein
MLIESRLMIFQSRHARTSKISLSLILLNHGRRRQLMIAKLLLRLPLKNSLIPSGKLPRSNTSTTSCKLSMPKPLPFSNWRRVTLTSRESLNKLLKKWNHIRIRQRKTLKMRTKIYKTRNLTLLGSGLSSELSHSLLLLLPVTNASAKRRKNENETPIKT